MKQFCKDYGVDEFMSKFCDNCGAELKDGVKFCDKCGNNVNEINNIQPSSGTSYSCPYCGESIPYSNRCPYCGKSLGNDDAKKCGFGVIAIFLLIIIISGIAGLLLLLWWWYYDTILR